jgi:hypothetical protein
MHLDQLSALTLRAREDRPSGSGTRRRGCGPSEPMHRLRAVVPPLLTVLAAVLAGCSADASPRPAPSSIVRPTPTPTPERPRFTQAVSQPATQLLATLPTIAGGEQLDGVQIVNDAFHVGHPVDDVLLELQKDRNDAVSVFRYGEDATIGATTVEGIDGATLFEAFVTTWNAPAVIERRQRLAAGGPAWELEDRLGTLTVVYRLSNVVYVVETADRARLEAILLDMPPTGIR